MEGIATDVQLTRRRFSAVGALIRAACRMIRNGEIAHRIGGQVAGQIVVVAAPRRSSAARH